MKKKAAEIAAAFEKQGMSAADAMKKAWQQITDDAVRGSTKTKTSISSMKSAFSSLGKTASRLGGVLTRVLGPISFIYLAKECMELGSSVREVQNVVDTAFGSMAYKMESFANSSIENFGMSELAAKKTGSTYMAMAKSIGISTDKASDMAVTLTGLTGDVASFYNISQDVASTRLKAVFTGETEAIKELGVVMTQTNLEQFALSRGISKSISAMTQAELATLRYNFVLDSLNLASGDFVKTQDSWANQTRILSMQLQALGANIGQILTTVLLPAVKTLNEIVANLVSATSIISAALSSIFGVQISQNSQIASTAAEAADAENNLAAGISNAAKAAKKSLAGFDELNVLQNDSGGGSGGGGSSGGAFDMSMSNETSVTPGEGLDTAKVERVAEIIKEIAGYVPVIVATLGGLKLGKFLTDLATANIETKTLKDALLLLGKKTLITLEIAVLLGGIALFGKGISDAFKEGVDGVNFAEILGGSLTTTGMIAALGAQLATWISKAFAGSKVATALTTAATNLFGAETAAAMGTGAAGAAGAALTAGGAGVLLGIPAMIAGIYDSLVNKIDWLSAALTAVGGAAAGAGVAVILTALGTAVAPGIGTLIGLAVGLVTDLVILIVQKWDEICAFFAPAIEWFDANVIQPIGGFFSNLWASISQWASDAWEDIKEFFTPAVQWFSDLFNSVSQTLSDIFYNISVIASGCWEVIKVVWGIVSNWFNENVVQPVAGFFSGLWDGFVEKARAAWEGVKTVFGKVASFFSDTFKKAWAGIVKVFSIAGDIFNDIKDGILTAFKSIVNGIIKGLNSAIAVPFNGINWALNKIKSIEIVGITPFSGLKTINVPQIPYLAQGAVLPPNKPFMAVVGDQRHGTNIEAPLSTIQEAVALVMQDQTSAILAGFEASVGVQREILEAVLGIQIGDDVIGNAVARYSRKQAVIRGGAL